MCDLEQPGRERVYLLGLDPHSEVFPAENAFGKVVEYVVLNLQPHSSSCPVVTHVELIVPTECRLDSCHFASYLGAQAGWQRNRASNENYYLPLARAGKLRAVPIFGSDAVNRVRRACAQVDTAPYSLRRYVTSTAPFFWLARLLPAEPTSPGHCATIAARVIRMAFGPLSRCDACYSPASLHAEVCDMAAQHAPRLESMRADTAAADAATRLRRGSEAEIETMPEADREAGLAYMSNLVALHCVGGASVERHSAELALGRALAFSYR